MDQNKERNSFVNSTAEKDERIEKLKQLYPELFSDGKLNIDVLKEITGGTNPQEERTPGYYGLYWPGKQKAKIGAKVAPKGTLIPVPGDGVKEDTTHNIYIEGDNLEVLRILKKSYKGRVKMIYIDPPYNTGNDLIYPDNYKMPVEEYLKLTGQIDEQGSKLTTNQKSNGAFHTNWLNMMMPRLMLARDLLTDDGIIFISIDENEFDNLKKICDEIFGEDNYIGDIIRKTKSTTEDIETGLNLQHEYLHIYAKNLVNNIVHGNEKDLTKYQNPDGDPKGDWCSGDPSAKSGGPSTYFPIQNPYTKKEDFPPKGRYWAFSKSTLEEYIKSGKIKFRKEYKENERGFTFKRYKNELKDNYNSLESLFSVSNGFMNQVATKELNDLFEFVPFSYPKPVVYIKHLIFSCTKENDIILDFFGGSSTTAHAVMQLNAEDGGNRKFILIQAAELTYTIDKNGKEVPTKEGKIAYDNGYKNICEIGKERIRRAAKKIKEETGKDIDYGFKVFRMQKTNFTSFTPVTGQDDKAEGLLFKELEKNATPLIDGWKKENVLNEIILKQGFSLDCDCKKVESFTKNTVYCIKDSDGPGSRTTTMYVCLDDEIKPETIASLKLSEQEKFVCLDNAIDDTNYARLFDKGRIETI